VGGAEERLEIGYLEDKEGGANDEKRIMDGSWGGGCGKPYYVHPFGFIRSGQGPD
jgi:hypothetical protein